MDIFQKTRRMKGSFAFFIVLCIGWAFVWYKSLNPKLFYLIILIIGLFIVSGTLLIFKLDKSLKGKNLANLENALKNSNKVYTYLAYTSILLFFSSGFF